MPDVSLTKNQRRSKVLKRIIGYAKADGVLKGEMAEALGLSRTSFWQKESSPEEFSLGELWKLLDFLSVPEDKRSEILK